MNKKIVSLLVLLLIGISGLVQAMDSKPGTEETAAMGVLSKVDVACIEKKANDAKQMETIVRVLYARAANNVKNEEDVRSILQTLEAINAMEAAEAAVELAGVAMAARAKLGNQKAYMTAKTDFQEKAHAFNRARNYASETMRAEAKKLRRDNDPKVCFFQGMESWKDILHIS